MNADPYAPIPIPPLALSSRGDVVVAETGEVVEPNLEPGRSDIALVFNAYADAKTRADAAALRIRQRKERLEHELVEPALDADQDHQADLLDLRAAEWVLSEVEATLNGFMVDRDDTVSLDAGRVRVTWPKPRETWTMAHPPSWYATREAAGELWNTIERTVPETLGPEAFDHMFQAILEWLRPTAKVGATPEVKITVRGDR